MEPLTAERRHALSKVGALQCEAEKLQTELMEMYEEFENHISYLKEHNTGALDAEKIGKMVWKKKSRFASRWFGWLSVIFRR